MIVQTDEEKYPKELFAQSQVEPGLEPMLVCCDDLDEFIEMESTVTVAVYELTGLRKYRNKTQRVDAG